MDGKTKMSFLFETGLPLLAQIEECAVKAFIDDFGVPPNACELPERYARELPSRIGKMEVISIKPGRVDPPNEFWVGVVHSRKS